MRRPQTLRAAVPWQAQYAVLACIWGLSFYFIKLGNETLDPIQVSFGRMAVGTAVLGAIVLVRREALPRSVQAWGHLLVTSALFNSIPMTLFPGRRHASRRSWRASGTGRRRSSCCS